MGAPQVATRHVFNQGSPVTIPDGSGAVGGQFVVIDSIDGFALSDVTVNRTLAVKVIAGGSTIAEWDQQVNASGAITALSFHFPFPAGFPVVGSDGNPLATISITASGTGVTVGSLSCDYHYRRFNG